jgi:hypothetical protein
MNSLPRQTAVYIKYQDNKVTLFLQTQFQTPVTPFESELETGTETELGLPYFVLDIRTVSGCNSGHRHVNLDIGFQESMDLC